MQLANNRVSLPYKNYTILLLFVSGRRCLLYLALCWAVLPSFGQKNDYIWLSGYGNNSPNDTDLDGIRFGNSIMDFNYSPVNVEYSYYGMPFYKTNVMFCSDAGELLFYCNGIFIANSSGDTMLNGDSLNAGYYLSYIEPNINRYGYPLPQGIVALQNPSDANQYYLLNSFVDTIPGSAGLNIYSRLSL
jgi:hypothetical protein